MSNQITEAAGMIRLLLVLVASLLAGCGTLGSTVVIDDEGNPQVVYGRDFGASPAVTYPQAQAAALIAMYENQRPLLRIEAREGQPIEINAALIEVYAPTANEQPRIAQYVSPWASVTENLGKSAISWIFGERILSDQADMTIAVANSVANLGAAATTVAAQSGQATADVAMAGLDTAETLGSAGITGVQQTATAGYQQIGQTAQAGLNATTTTAQAGLNATTSTAQAGLTALQNTSTFALGELGDTGRFGMSALGELGETGIVEAGRDPVIVNPTIVEQPTPVQIPGAPSPVIVNPVIVEPPDPIFGPPPIIVEVPVAP